MGAQDIPDAISKRQSPLSVGGQVIMIDKWAVTKLITIMSWLTKNLKGAAALFDAKTADTSTFGFAQALLDGLGDKLPEFLQLALGAEQAASVMEMPADDCFEVLVEILKVNLTDKLSKKVKELFGLFKSMLPANGKST
jgi:hypothetical protein